MPIPEIPQLKMTRDEVRAVIQQNEAWAGSNQPAWLYVLDKLDELEERIKRLEVCALKTIPFTDARGTVMVPIPEHDSPPPTKRGPGRP